MEPGLRSFHAVCLSMYLITMKTCWKNDVVNIFVHSEKSDGTILISISGFFMNKKRTGSKLKNIASWRFFQSGNKNRG